MRRPEPVIRRDEPVPLLMVDRDHNLTPPSNLDESNPASLLAGTWITYPTVRDAAQKHHPGFGATSEDATLPLTRSN